MIDLACFAFAAVVILATLALIIRPRRARPTIQQQQLGKVIEFPKKEDRLKFQSRLSR